MQLARADGAFIGHLVAAHRSDSDGGAAIAYSFEVTEWIKGDLDPGRFDVWSSSQGSACGFGLRVGGGDVAVYLLASGGRLSGGLCSTGDAASLHAVVRAHRSRSRPADTGRRAGRVRTTSLTPKAQWLPLIRLGSTNHPLRCKPLAEDPSSPNAGIVKWHS